jgi:hypothetical protein
MATSKLNPPKEIPEGFVYPFKRVPQEERIDDSLALVATLGGTTLEVIRNQAFEFGLPKNGPAWVDQKMIASDWKETSSIAALPLCAFLSVDVKNDYGRFVLWTHFKGNEQHESMSIILDPGSWVAPENHLTREWKHLDIAFPLYYFEITKKPAAAGKSK